MAAGSTGHCNTARSLSAGVSKPEVFRGWTFAPDALFQLGLDREQLLKSIAGHSLGPASLVVRYRREL